MIKNVQVLSVLFIVTNKSSLLRERKSVHIMKVRDEETVELQRRLNSSTVDKGVGGESKKKTKKAISDYCWKDNICSVKCIQK